MTSLGRAADLGGGDSDGGLQQLLRLLQVLAVLVDILYYIIYIRVEKAVWKSGSGEGNGPILVQYWSNTGSKEVDPHALSPGGGPRCWSVNSQILVKYWSKDGSSRTQICTYIYTLIYIFGRRPTISP